MNLDLDTIILMQGDHKDEIIRLVTQYDFTYMYIEDYGQMKQAEQNNNLIEVKLKQLGVTKLNNRTL